MQDPENLSLEKDTIQYTNEPSNPQKSKCKKGQTLSQRLESIESKAIETCKAKSKLETSNRRESSTLGSLSNNQYVESLRNKKEKGD